MKAEEGHVVTIRAEHAVAGRGFVVRAAEFGVEEGGMPGWFKVSPAMIDGNGVEWGAFTPARPVIEGNRCTGWMYLDMSGHEIMVEL